MAKFRHLGYFYSFDVKFIHILAEFWAALCYILTKSSGHTGLDLRSEAFLVAKAVFARVDLGEIGRIFYEGV